MPSLSAAMLQNDNMLFTNAKLPDDVVYKIIDTMENNKAGLVEIQPALREFSAAGLYKKYDIKKEQIAFIASMIRSMAESDE